MTTTSERFERMNDLILGIARRSAYKFKTKDAEELAQELWVHVLQEERKVGKELDLGLIAEICYRQIVDIQRYDMKRNTSSYDAMLETEDVVSHKGSLESGYISGNDFETKVMVDELFKIFPEGSKERIFLEFWGTAAGVKDFGHRPQTESANCDGYTENALAKLLGYANCSSSGYKRFRTKVRVIIEEYLDI